MACASGAGDCDETLSVATAGTRVAGRPLGRAPSLGALARSWVADATAAWGGVG